MKHGVRPTVAQKKLMTERGLKSKDWLVSKDTQKAMTIVSRDKTRSMVIFKEG